ncbi:MAG: hypothetical protein CSA20_03365 [Deltaproteobacteria bacterium]|nr:MAG: hypothetical protein CSB23_02645 [Deltaproteobacteria bacterium]PIE73139.1 MAG: hypothetical protein CSA20_03365 [Deltaproteobacteria bacterium]
MERPAVKYSYLLLFILFSCWGCTHIGGSMPPEEMETAEELFLYKNYREAAEAFSRIQRQTEKESLRQKAFLGQICSQMLLADNENRSLDTLQLWQTWCGRQADTSPSKDLCTFFTPVVKQWTEATKKAPVETSQKEKFLGQGLNSREGSDPARLLADQEQKLQRLRSQIKKKNQDIEELNTKLKALEAIHQEIDQKKKGMDFQ